MKEIHWLILQKVPRSVDLLELSPGIKELAGTIYLSFSLSLTGRALGVPFWHLPSTRLESPAFPGVPLHMCPSQPTLPGQPSSTAALALPYPVGNLGWDWFSTLSRWPQTEPECSSKQLLPQRGLAQPTKAPPPEVCGWTWPPDMQSSGLASESALLGVSSPHLPTHLQQTQPGLGDATHRDRLGSGMLCCGDCT